MFKPLLEEDEKEGGGALLLGTRILTEKVHLKNPLRVTPISKIIVYTYFFNLVKKIILGEKGGGGQILIPNS